MKTQTRYKQFNHSNLFYSQGDVAIDGDDPTHIQWIFEKAQERADQYNIMGVTYRLTQGEISRVKHETIVVCDLWYTVYLM